MTYICTGVHTGCESRRGMRVDRKGTGGVQARYNDACMKIP